MAIRLLVGRFETRRAKRYGTVLRPLRSASSRALRGANAAARQPAYSLLHSAAHINLAARRARRTREAMLRGFGTATNATLKELLASDTDGAEDPGDGDDVDAFVRAASPLFGASDEPWTHESIKPPATPPRSPERRHRHRLVPADAAELSRARRDGDGRFTTHARRVPSKPAVSTHELHGRD